jgi:hypothetical protein
MTKNVGDPDRLLRIIVGLGVLSLLFLLEGNQRWLGLIGLVPLLTAVVSFCPAYTLIGLNTCGRCGMTKES